MLPRFAAPVAIAGLGLGTEVFVVVVVGRPVSTRVPSKSPGGRAAQNTPTTRTKRSCDVQGCGERTPGPGAIRYLGKYFQDPAIFNHLVINPVG